MPAPPPGRAGRLAATLLATLPAAMLALLAATPLLWAAVAAVHAGLDAAAWREVLLLQQPQWPRALLHTLFTGVTATAVSVAVTAWVLSLSFGSRRWLVLTRLLAPLLAVPHAAFAIGLAFLLAPSGWLLRAVSPWATGLQQPPDWPTTQDPWGLGLILALVGKEVPFLLWTAASQLQRADAGVRWARELDLARTLGYARHTAWWRVVWPQLRPRLAAPVLAVLAYSLTVVDMALIIGPASPPTAAVLAWQWLLDADAQVNAQGAAAAWMLAGVVAVMALAVRGLQRWQPGRARRTTGRRGSREAGGAATLLPALGLAGGYLLAMAVLAVSSVAGVWPFPHIWPTLLSLEGWRSVFASADTLAATLGLAAASSVTALAWGVAWLECAPPAWDRRLRRIAYLPLMLPSVLWVVGLHRLGLAWGVDGRWTGLWLAHTLAALPYVLIALSPSYLAFDARYGQLTASLGRSRAAFLLRVKWPLLRAGLASSLAVAFAVSVAQYLPTVFLGAGRFATVTTEAVTLSSGGQRSLVAAYAWLQWLLPAAVFAGAAWLGRPRRFAGRRPA